MHVTNEALSQSLEISVSEEYSKCCDRPKFVELWDVGSRVEWDSVSAMGFGVHTVQFLEYFIR